MCINILKLKCKRLLNFILLNLKIILQKENIQLPYFCQNLFFKDWSIHLIKYAATFSSSAEGRATCSIGLLVSINATQNCTLPFLHCVEAYVKFSRLFFTHWKGTPSYDCKIWGMNQLFLWIMKVTSIAKYKKKQKQNQIIHNFTCYCGLFFSRGARYLHSHIIKKPPHFLFIFYTETEQSVGGGLLYFRFPSDCQLLYLNFSRLFLFENWFKTCCVASREKLH